MNPLLAQIVALIFEIVNRHTPQPKTKEEIEAAVRAELAKGDNTALAWFIEKGMTPPA